MSSWSQWGAVRSSRPRPLFASSPDGLRERTRGGDERGEPVADAGSGGVTAGLGWPETRLPLRWEIATAGRSSGVGWPRPPVSPVERTTTVSQTPLNPGDSPLVREALSSVVSRETAAAPPQAAAPSV